MIVYITISTRCSVTFWDFEFELRSLLPYINMTFICRYEIIVELITAIIVDNLCYKTIYEIDCSMQEHVLKHPQQRSNLGLWLQLALIFEGDVDVV